MTLDNYITMQIRVEKERSRDMTMPPEYRWKHEVILNYMVELCSEYDRLEHNRKVRENENK